MATKKQIVETMTAVLKESGIELCLPDKYQLQLCNEQWGYEAGYIYYNDGEIMCRPWNGMNIYWRARLEERLTKKEIYEVWRWVRHQAGRPYELHLVTEYENYSEE